MKAVHSHPKLVIPRQSKGFLYCTLVVNSVCDNYGSAGTQIVFNLNTKTDLPCFFLTGDLKIKISV